MTQKRVSSSEEETKKIAREFTQNLHGGEIVALSGDLGSGKTVFVKGVAAGLGIQDIVTSPTFVLMKSYAVPQISRKLSFLRRDEHGAVHGLNSGRNPVGVIPAEAGIQKQDVKKSRHTIQHLLHVDTYRLTTPQELIDIGLLDYLGRQDTVVAIEWPEKIAAILKDRLVIYVRIVHREENKRQIQLETVKFLF